MMVREERAWFRIVMVALGCYHLIYAAAEWPYLALLYGDPSHSSLFQGLGPAASIGCARAAQVVRLLAALLLLVGRFERGAGLFLLLASLILRGLNTSLSSPEEAYLNWMALMIFVFSPGLRDGSALAARQVRGLSWWVAGVSYFCAGFFKLQSGDWIRGQALSRVLQDSHLARSWTQVLLEPSWTQFLHLATVAVLVIELSCVVLMLRDGGRKLSWLMLALLHFSVLATLNLNQVSWGALVFLLILVDPRWRVVAAYHSESHSRV